MTKNKGQFVHKLTTATLARALLAAVSILLAEAATARAERLLTDMAGRKVAIPDKVSRVATVGPVPVLNGFVFAMGEAGTIINNLPPNLGGPRWRFQYVVAPALAQHQVVQNGDGLSLESLLDARPDVVLTMDVKTIDLVARVHIPALYLSWRQPEDVKTAMRLLGELYGKPGTAESYCRYFDEVLARVGKRLDSLDSAQRPRVLYMALKHLTQPHLIAEWWIAKAGGRSVTDGGRNSEAQTFSIEQLLLWDPEVLIVSTPQEIADAYADARLAGVSAIKSRRVYAVPMGVHLWGNRTVEQPLTVLWAAKLFHPAAYADISIGDEVASFYATFFKTPLTGDQIGEILEGKAGQH